MTFQRPPDGLLLALDLGPATASLLERARAYIAARPGCRIVLVHVVDTRLLSAWGGEHAAESMALASEAVAAARRVLSDLAGRLRVAGAGEVVVECSEGSPAALLGAAITAHVPALALIGVGTRDWRRTALGGTGLGLLRNATVPVWLVRRAGDASVRRVLVATDFQPGAARAAALAVDLWPDADFDLLHVVEHAEDFALPEETWHAALASLQAAMLSDARKRLSSLAGDAFAARAASVRVQEGHPVGVTLRMVESGRPDVLVLGRSGRTGMEAAILGNVAESLAGLVDCDVLVVPAADDR